jgi:hypothetical protein
LYRVDARSDAKDSFGMTRKDKSLRIATFLKIGDNFFVLEDNLFVLQLEKVIL